MEIIANPLSGKNQGAEIIQQVKKYLEERNDGHPLRGSSNQRIYYRDEAVKKQYEQYIEEQKDRNSVQMFPTSDGTVLVGIHQRNFKEQLEKTMRERGVNTGDSRNGG